MVNYVVNAMRTVTTLRGPMKSGKLVFASDFTRGEKALVDLVRNGSIIESKVEPTEAEIRKAEAKPKK